MADIAVGLLGVGGVSLALFWAAHLMARRLSGWQCDLMAAAIVLLTFSYLHSLWYSVKLAEWLPYSNLIVIGNWFPPLSALLVGTIWTRLPGRAPRRVFTSGCLIVTASATVAAPLLGNPPECGDSWTRDGFCLQTTDESCSAACAASVLNRVGIEATEQEMSELCFSAGGTTWLGLYRGLKLKTADTSWDVRVLDRAAKDLPEQVAQPMILSVGIEPGARVDGGFELESGWKPGFRHSVLLLGTSSTGQLEISDPNPQIGRERWSIDELEYLFRGPALQLVRRK